MKPIIEVENIGKRYQIGATKEPYLSLRDEIVKWISPSARRAKAAQEELWALKDISFNVQEGEAVGIIGRNGAGKSTLLKILSKITPPTEGKIKMRGRVASLLEVGTGFHPELTGRENIYLNGAILGMTRAEIRKKFDEIVDFAEIEKFLDTPVKRYSSGMYVRLAFAIAAHLEPEILLVDEILAVGDVAFQKKCLGKMEKVAGEGRTVLFVSHNMAVIQELCKTTILLCSGKLTLNNETVNVVSKYLNQLSSESMGAIVDTNYHPNRLSKMKSIIYKVTLQNNNGEFKNDFNQGEIIVLNVFYNVSDCEQTLAGCGFHIKSLSGVRVGGFNTYMGTDPLNKLPKKGKVIFYIEKPILTPGRYMITVNVGPHQNILTDNIESVIVFNINTLDIYKTGYLLTPEDGVVAMKCNVSIENN